MEIERKFLIDRFPCHLAPISEAIMEQGYICTNPVVRIRSKQTATGIGYRLCFKGEGTLVRQEIEIDLSEKQFGELRLLIPIPLIKKEWKLYDLGSGVHLEVSCVDRDTPTQMYYAEVEFDSVQEAESFVPPDFLGREVTEDTTFTMSSYWERKSKHSTL